jgi:hypothetical protein
MPLAHRSHPAADVDVRRSARSTRPSLATGSSVTRRPEAATSVELIWKVPPPVLPVHIPMPRLAMGTPLGMPSMHELANVAKHVANASSLVAAAAQLQRDACKLLRVTNAACIWIDWPRRTASTLEGRLGEQLEELVLEVAGCGRRSLIGSSLVEPLGPPPTRAVLALRKPTGTTFDSSELTLIRTLAAGIAPALDRLIATSRNDDL